MLSHRRARISSIAVLSHRLARLLLGFSLAGLLVSAAVAAQAQSQSSDMTPSNEAQKGAGGPLTSNVGARLDLATLDTAALLRDCDRNGTEIHRQLLNYTYRLKKIRREYNGDGKSSEKQLQEFEAYPVRGQHVLIQVRENGQPLPSVEVEWQRRRAGERLEQAEREAEQQAQNGKAAADEPDGYPAAGVYSRIRRHPVGFSIDPSTILRSGELTAPRIEQLGERETVAFDFRMPSGVALPPRQTYMARLSGRVWIDTTDKVIVRLEAWPVAEFRKTDPIVTAEPRLVYQQTKLDSGVWVPTLMRINSAGNPTLFDGLNWDVVFEFGEYKQFKTSSDDMKIDAKKNHHK